MTYQRTAKQKEHQRTRARTSWNRQAPKKAEKVARYPKASWWLVPRERWAEALAKEEGRMKAGGASAEPV
jgi:hypothetical protein